MRRMTLAGAVVLSVCMAIWPGPHGQIKAADAASTSGPTSRPTSGPTTSASAKGDGNAPMGSANYYPSAQRPIGWRGDGTGHYPGATPPTEWSRKLEDGRYVVKNIRWITRLGQGGSSLPIVVGDRLFVTANSTANGRGPLELYCLDALTGRVLWMRSHTQYDLTTAEDRKVQDVAQLADPIDILKRLDEQMVKEINAGVSSRGTASPPTPALLKRRQDLVNQIHDTLTKYDKARFPTIGRGEWGFASPTPVSDGKNVYVYFTSMVAMAYDLDGRLLWLQRVPPADQYREYEHNFHASPVLADGKLIISNAARVAALDAATGKVEWLVSFMSEKGYDWLVHSSRSLLLERVAGQNVVILPNAIGVKVSDGQTAFDGGIPHGFDGASTAVIHDGVRYEVTRGGVFAARVPQAIGGSWTMLQKFTAKDHSEWVERSCSSQLYHDGLVYYVNHQGLLRVWDIVSPAMLYEQKLDLKPIAKLTVVNPGVTASPTLAGKYIYIWDEQGNAVVIEPGRAFKQVAANAIAAADDDGNMDGAQDMTLACPVFHGDRIYLRGQRYMYCIAPDSR